MRVAAVLTSIALVSASTGCVAYKAATPGWFNAEPAARSATHTPDQRAHVIRRRAVIATVVGLAELAIGAALTVAVATGNLHVEDGEDPGSGGGSGIGDAAEAAGKQVLGLIMATALAAGATLSGIGDLGCGIHDLVTASTCDRAMQELDRTHGGPEPHDPDAGADGPPIGAVGTIHGVSPRGLL